MQHAGNTCIEYQSKIGWDDGGQRVLASLPDVKKWTGTRSMLCTVYMLAEVARQMRLRRCN